MIACAKISNLEWKEPSLAIPVKAANRVLRTESGQGGDQAVQRGG